MATEGEVAQHRVFGIQQRVLEVEGAGERCQDVIHRDGRHQAAMLVPRGAAPLLRMKGSQLV